MGNIIQIGGEALKPKWRQVPVAYGQVSMRGTIDAGQWVVQPREPFRIVYLLTWLADSAPAAKLTAFQICGVDYFAGPVAARAFEASISIEELLGKYLKCSGAGQCLMCAALGTRPSVLNFANQERVATPRGFALEGLPIVEVGSRIVIEHGPLQGLALIGVTARAVEP